MSDKVEVGREAFPDDCIIERIPDKDEKTEVKIQNSDNKVTTDNRNRRGSIDR